MFYSYHYGFLICFWRFLENKMFITIKKLSVLSFKTDQEATLLVCLEEKRGGLSISLRAGDYVDITTTSVVVNGIEFTP